MIIYHSDPSGLLESKRYDVDYKLSIQDNLIRCFPDGLDKDKHYIVLNGERIDPENYNLDIPITQFDNIQVVRHQQAPAIPYIVAIIAAVVAYALVPKPKTPNSTGEQKDSTNNKLTGQTNIARAYQAKPDIYGNPRVYPDLVKPSGSEYIKNIKYVDHLLCVGIGNYELTNLKYAETPLDRITGTEYKIYQKGDILPIVMYQYASDEVNGQELVPPNLNTEPLREIKYPNFVNYENSGAVASVTLNSNDDITYLRGLYLPAAISFTVSTTVTYVRDNVTYTKNTNGIYYGNLQSVTYNNNRQPVLTVSSVDFSGYGDSVDGTITNSELNTDLLAVQRKSGVYTDAFVLPEEGREIWVNLVFQRGLKGSGGNGGGTVEIKFTYWKIDDLGNEILNTRENYTWVYSNDTYEPQNQTVKIRPKGGSAKYAIICGRTNNGNSDLSDQVKVENIYIITYDYNFKVNDTLVYIRTKATSQATGIKELKFNVNAHRKTITYDLDKKQIIYTESPSMSFADAVLHEYVIVSGEDAEELDLDALYTIDKQIKEKDERLGYFDFSFDDADISLGQRIQTICNAARVFTYKDGRKWRFVRDQKQTRPAALFNSSNLAQTSDGGTMQFKSSLPSSFDGVELEWVNSSLHNPESGTDKKAYIKLRIDQITQSIVSGEARRPNKIQLAGCRNYKQAMDRAMLEARKLIYQRIIIEDEALQDAAYINKGDLVRWCDAWDETIANGEIIDIKDDRFIVNQTLKLEGDKQYRVTITDKNGYPSEWVDVIDHDERSFKADFKDAYLANHTNIQMGSIFIITETISDEPMDFILTDKKYNDGNFKINLVNYDERIYQD